VDRSEEVDHRLSVLLRSDVVGVVEGDSAIAQCEILEGEHVATAGAGAATYGAIVRSATEGWICSKKRVS
jgi:hypothetical protein